MSSLTQARASSGYPSSPPTHMLSSPPESPWGLWATFRKQSASLQLGLERRGAAEIACYGFLWSEVIGIPAVFPGPLPSPVSGLIPFRDGQGEAGELCLSFRDWRCLTWTACRLAKRTGNPRGPDEGQISDTSDPG